MNILRRRRRRRRRAAVTAAAAAARAEGTRTHFVYYVYFVYICIWAIYACICIYMYVDVERIYLSACHFNNLHDVLSSLQISYSHTCLSLTHTVKRIRTSTHRHTKHTHR